MMNEMYQDFKDGTFIPDVVVKKRADNGHYTATAMGLSATHHDQAEAVNQLTTKIQEGLVKGELFPEV